MKTKYPVSTRYGNRNVVAHTTDGREITVPTAVLESDVDRRWAPYARIEAADG